MAELRTREMEVIAQDPGVKRDGRILTTPVKVRWEDLEPGPMGHRVYVVDYDSSTQTMYKPAVVGENGGTPSKDEELLGDPSFHARNVYALVMRTLARFEYALGRRVEWGFKSHQLKVVPHAFEEMNAFYSKEDESLVFGYYQTEHGVHFTCLSHDVVVHETSHALLDGLRKRFLAPSSPDQAAFHEGFGDIIALLSVFSLNQVLLTLLAGGMEGDGGSAAAKGLIHEDGATSDALMDSVLLGLADQMGADAGTPRAGALRRSVRIEPDPSILERPEYQEAHARGEILVAAMMRTFVDVWTRRLTSLGRIEGKYFDLGRVAEEGAMIAEALLAMAIRAIDYTPPIHIDFGDYLSALLTADEEIRADDSRYGLRTSLTEWFGRYGITPGAETEDGRWTAPEKPLLHDGVRFASLQSEPIEMFSLLWANRRQLRLDPGAYTQVTSLRPCVRISPDDGLPLRETVAECTQYVKVPASELGRFGLKPPAGMKPEQEVVLEGGSTFVLDEYGRLKFEIYNPLPSKDSSSGNARAQARLQYLWDSGAMSPGASLDARLSNLHRQRLGLDDAVLHSEVW